jgi:3-hydroxybutyryl-CoA dehydrogenase
MTVPSSNSPSIKQVGVLGGGLMGSGIAQVCAQSGYTTIVREISDAACDKARTSIEKTLAKGVEKGKVTPEEQQATLSRITYTTDLSALKSSDIIIEAVVEDLNVKKTMFNELDSLCPPHTIFASNTSSLTITEMAATTNRADRFVGLHFFNPVPLMKLVEVVRALQTSEQTFNNAFDFAKSLGKEPIRAQDRSGFVVNYLLVPYMIDAIRALESGVASIEDIDKGMTLGAGHPMGPFTLLDFVGLDTTYKIAEIMFNEYREPRYAPPPLLKRMVTAGLYGKKVGKGFYDYSQNPPVPNKLEL